jgi:hypothetical protein
MLQDVYFFKKKWEHRDLSGTNLKTRNVLYSFRREKITKFPIQRQGPYFPMDGKYNGNPRFQQSKLCSGTQHLQIFAMVFF